MAQHSCRAMAFQTHVAWSLQPLAAVSKTRHTKAACECTSRHFVAALLLLLRRAAAFVTSYLSGPGRNPATRVTPPSAFCTGRSGRCSCRLQQIFSGYPLANRVQQAASAQPVAATCAAAPRLLPVAYQSERAYWLSAWCSVETSISSSVITAASHAGRSRQQTMIGCESPENCPAWRAKVLA